MMHNFRGLFKAVIPVRGGGGPEECLKWENNSCIQLTSFTPTPPTTHPHPHVQMNFSFLMQSCLYFNGVSVFGESLNDGQSTQGQCPTNFIYRIPQPVMEGDRIRTCCMDGQMNNGGDRGPRGCWDLRWGYANELSQKGQWQGVD